MKKVFIVLLLVIIIFSGFLYFLGGQEPVAYQAPENNSQSLIVKKDSVDRDADGLADWEEEFWGSDPLNKDTDGDGAEDGAEVTVGRSPIVAGPNDKIVDPTERLLALTRVAIKHKQEPLLPAINNLPTVSAYKVSDIKISVSPANTEAVESYSQKVREVMKVYDDPNTINEMILTLGVIEKNEIANVEKLKQTTSKHLGAVHRLLAIEVPKGGEQIHLNLINALVRMTELSYMMSQVVDEPALALGAVNRYGEQLNFLLAQIKNLNTYLVGNGVKFAKGEALNFSLGL